MRFAIAIAVLIALASCQEFEEGGVALKVTNKLLSNIQHQLLQALFEHLQQGDSFKVDFEKDMSLFKAFAHVELNIERWKLDFDNSVFTFNQDMSQVFLHLQDFTCNLNGNFNLTTNPPFYIDQGPMDVNVAPINLTMGFNVT